MAEVGKGWKNAEAARVFQLVSPECGQTRIGGVSLGEIAHLASMSGEALMVFGTPFYCPVFGRWHRLPACVL
jgi:hypothetical protein